MDSAYAISKLSKLPVAKRFFEFSPETVGYFESVAALRNYMDHLAANFRNSVKSVASAPLFGWLTYQYTPFLADRSASPKVIFVTNVGSMHLKDKFNIDMAYCSTLSVLAAIDNIMLHVRKNDRVNLSQLLGNMTLDLNRFSIAIQTYLVQRLEDASFDHGGLKIPFPQVIARGDLDNPITCLDIATPLNHDKMRAEVTVEAIDPARD